MSSVASASRDREQAHSLPAALSVAAEASALAGSVAAGSGIHFYNARSGERESHSYAELDRDARVLAAQLQSAGLREGASVALILSTSYAFVRALFAVLRAGAVPCCLPTPRLGRMADYQTSTRAMLMAAGVSLVLSEASLEKQLSGLLAEIPAGARPALRFVPRASPFDAAEQAEADLQPFESHVPDACASVFEEASATPGDRPALIQFSSGTTVAPKPVVLTHENILSNTHAILASFPGEPYEHSGCSWLPLHHDMGLIGGLFAAIVAHGDMTFLRPEDFIARPAAWLRALSESRATICPAPNFALQICCDRVRDADLEGIDLSHWSIALIGAETVREATLRRFADRFAATGFRYTSFTPVYGLAEATLAVTFSAVTDEARPLYLDAQALSRGEAVVAAAPATVQSNSQSASAVDLLSVGRPLRDIELEIRDASGAVLPQRRIGRIFVRGPGVMRGYLGAPEATARVIQDGWLDTGDLGFLFDDRLYIYGRERDIIILNGRNHDPQSIEFALDTVAGLGHDRAAAVAIDDAERGTESFVVLVEKEKGAAQIEPGELATQAREAVIAGTGLIPAAVAILPTGQLPRTTSGKIRRAAAGRAYAAGELTVLSESLR